MTWQATVPIDSLSDGQVLGLSLGGVEVTLYRLGAEVFATHGVCTHALAFLKDGFVVGGEIECPLHQGRFDIRTGRAMCAPLTKDLPVYAVEVRDGVVWVDPETVLTAPAAAPAVVTPGVGNVVVVGAGQAAAAAIRSMRVGGYTGAIALVGEEPHLPYERPPLSKTSLTDPEAEHPPCLTAEDAAALGVALHLGHAAVSVVDGVTLDDGRVLPADAVLLATGGRARRLSVPGAELPGIFTLRNREDAAAIASVLRQAHHAVVIGGGFIGLELASAARALDVAVTVLEAAPTLMARVMPPALGEAFATLATTHGVALRCGTAVTGLRPDGPGLIVETSSGEIATDCVLVGVGMEPEVTLARDAGCDILLGGIAVDRDGRSSVSNIFAAGDCAVLRQGPNGAPLRLESWQNAEDAGAAAGRAMAGAPAVPARRPWFWTDQFGVNAQMLGVPQASDRVARRGDTYICCDPATSVPRAVLAFDDPGAVRDAKALLDAAMPFDPAAHDARWLDIDEESNMDTVADALSLRRRFAWPAEGLTRIPDWVYTDDTIYQREVERIFHGRTWNCVGLESEIDKPGDFIRSHVGPTPVVVSRAEDGSIHVFENRCTHRAAEFCRELSGNVGEFVCPYHQWTYDLKGNLQGVPFRRGVAGKGGMPEDFHTADHGPRKLKVTTHRGVIFATYAEDMESFADYLGPDVLREFEATFDGRKLVVLGHYRHTLPGNWKLYHENLKDPYHATLLHTFLVTFGLLVAGNKSLMLADDSGRHGVMCSAKSDKKVNADDAKEMRAYKEGMRLEDPRIMDFFDEFDSPWSVTMSTIWPNLIVQREMNTLGIRQIVPTGPHEFIMKWTMFGFEGDTPEMTRHRLRQGNLMGPAGFLGLEDNEAMKFVQDGMKNVPGGQHMVALDPATPAGTSDTLISEAAIRAMYRHWRQAMAL